MMKSAWTFLADEFSLFPAKDLNIALLECGA